MAKFRAGKTGRTVVNGQTISNQEWSTTYHGDKLDTTNFESNGNQEELIGITGVSWSMSGNWDASKNPISDPPGIYPRDDGTNAQLYTKVADNVNWSFPSWCCTSADVAATTRGTVSFKSAMESQGAFTPPQGSV